MMIAVDIGLLLLIALTCGHAYRHRGSRLFSLPHLLLRKAYGRGFLGQLFLFALMAVGWLMLCHRVNTHGWHATAAGLILLAMTFALEAMRTLEEQQKSQSMEHPSCESSSH